jgi:hypothetical protein
MTHFPQFCRTSRNSFLSFRRLDRLDLGMLGGHVPEILTRFRGLPRVRMVKIMANLGLNYGDGSRGYI